MVNTTVSALMEFRLSVCGVDFKFLPSMLFSPFILHYFKEYLPPPKRATWDQSCSTFQLQEELLKSIYMNNAPQSWRIANTILPGILPKFYPYLFLKL